MGPTSPHLLVKKLVHSSSGYLLYSCKNLDVPTNYGQIDSPCGPLISSSTELNIIHKYVGDVFGLGMELSIPYTTLSMTLRFWCRKILK